MLMESGCGAAVGSTGATYLAAGGPPALSLVIAPLLLDARAGGPWTAPLSLLLLLPPAADGAAVDGPAGEVAALLPTGVATAPPPWAGCPVKHTSTKQSVVSNTLHASAAPPPKPSVAEGNNLSQLAKLSQLANCHNVRKLIRPNSFELWTANLWATGAGGGPQAATCLLGSLCSRLACRHCGLHRV
jgi:hypothetical protein